MVLAILIWSGLGILCLLAILGGLLRKRINTIKQQLPKTLLLDEKANSFGLKSKGTAQIRGNGVLALTADQLIFNKWWPKEELIINREDITQVTTTTSFLGKTRGVPLLQIDFKRQDTQDSIAFHLQQIDEWIIKLSVK